MATPHNAADPGDIAEICLMPGDPLRAKWIAENFFDRPVCFNTVRGMLGYTGEYHGKRLSVMGHGMGMPSIGIYSYELFSQYGVETILRIGSVGSLDPALELGNVLLAQAACTDSCYAAQYRLPGTFAPTADFTLLRRAAETAEAQGLPVRAGSVLSTDVFYQAAPDYNEAWRRMGVLGVEMECAALYLNAAFLGKKALGILTVTDLLDGSGRCMTAEERRTGLRRMIGLALETACRSAE